MSLKRYYDLLNLPETADTAEVRRQYRKLAMRLHPDKNPDPLAQEHFIRITEAYEILLGKKEAPFTRKSSKHSKTPAKTTEDRIREARKRYHEQLQKEHEENERYFQSLFRGRNWKLIKIGSLFGVFLAFCVTLDLLLPHHFEKDTLTHYSTEVYSGGRNIDVFLVRTQTNKEFWIANLDYPFFGENQTLSIQRSWLFHDPINLISQQKTRYVPYPVYYTFYSISPVLILLFLLPMFTRYYKRRTVSFTVMYYLSLYVSNGIMLLFVLTNDRWAHLLTLGFL